MNIAIVLLVEAESEWELVFRNNFGNKWETDYCSIHSNFFSTMI